MTVRSTRNMDTMETRNAYRILEENMMENVQLEDRKGDERM
jgi:hypothetical protein